MIRIAAAFLATLTLATPALARCADAPGACKTKDGEYHAALPDDPAAGNPVVMFLHGAGSTGANAMGNRKMITPFLARGYAVIAPTAKRQFRNGPGRVWDFYPGWDGRDEPAFLRGVIADAAERFGVDPTRVLLAGFSAGGFMVNYLACDAPESFAAYAPVSGGFWRPHPKSCKGPVKLFHTHGWNDPTVPLEGRFLGNGRYQQGDIFAGLEIWRAANKCADEKPSSFSQTDMFWRRKWADCDADSALEFALFPGAHTVPRGWSDMVLDWFEQVVAN